MKTALIHIGTMKTGNTSLHHGLAMAGANGLLGKVVYPRWRGELHQARMAALYSVDRMGELLPSQRERYPADEGRFRQMLQAYRTFVFAELRRACSAIISAEPFAHLFSADMALALRRDLEAAGFQSFRIVLYVRDPADYYLSITNQNLRMTTTTALVEDPATFRYPFLEIADVWERAFPGEVVVRKYPAGSGAEVFEDFNAVLMDTFGLAIPRISLRKNTGLSAEAMQIMLEYRTAYSGPSSRKLTPGAARFADFLLGSAEILPQTKPVLKPAIRDRIRSEHAADARALHRRYGVDLELGEPAPSTTAPPSDPWSVDEIVTSLDPVIMQRLLLHAAREGFERPLPKRSVPYRAAAMIYARLPERLKSQCLREALMAAL